MTKVIDSTGSIKTGGGSGLADIVSDTTPQLGGQLDVNGFAIGDGTLELLTFTETASAVNNINITNNATASAPIISSVGDDTNIGLVLDTKGTGTLALGSADSILTMDGSSISGTLIKDEDTMTSDSATHLASQQSIKAYVDNVAGFSTAASAYHLGSQTISTATATKVQMNTEVYDTGSFFDPTTNYRYTPTIAGKYLITSSVEFNAVGTGTVCVCYVYKNGSVVNQAYQVAPSSTTMSPFNATMVSLNGSTDYIEIYCYQNSGGNINLIGDPSHTWVQVVLVEKD